jgi:hypothetical protein
VLNLIALKDNAELTKKLDASEFFRQQEKIDLNAEIAALHEGLVLCLRQAR